jgi:hypothetical protein
MPPQRHYKDVDLAMTITAYQIQNIIQTYNRQLKARVAERPGAPEPERETLPEDVVDISAEGKKRLILETTGNQAVRNLKQQALQPLKQER